MNQSSDQTAVPRRNFLTTSAASTASLMLVSSKTAFTATANSALRMGVIGCGGRGNHVSGVFIRNTNSQIIGLADFFQDRLESTQQGLGERLLAMDRKKIESSKLFAGMDGYKKLLEEDLDHVLITSPPYYHPLHLEAVVNAGKHVYCEKPVAVDVAGAKRVMEIGKKAHGKVSLMVGFQIRESPEYQEVQKRIQNGDIGDPVAGMVHYHSGRLGVKKLDNASEQEFRLRNWVFDQVLSGDIITEQNVHVIDVCNWFLDGHPVKAVGTGGRKARTDVGDCWDHFEVIYDYPGEVKISFGSSQYLTGWGECLDRVFGTKGVGEASYGGGGHITGPNDWHSERKSLLGGAEESKVKKLEESIRSGNFVNQAEIGATSTLTCVLGRMAAYGNKEVTWDEMMKSNLKYDAKIKL
ncbi:MAG: Gfo/Idh/MocA family oxidoreductase [Candidatus Hinthialibacter antarcticus]|nr:Gfo/Idh/MocA family oxidoreductase [Candidatus Hinthialibacter antarcticus]